MDIEKLPTVDQWDSSDTFANFSYNMTEGVKL